MKMFDRGDHQLWREGSAITSVFVSYDECDGDFAFTFSRFLVGMSVRVYDSHLYRSPEGLHRGTQVLRDCTDFLLIGSLRGLDSSRWLSYEFGLALGLEKRMHWFRPITDRDEARSYSSLTEQFFVDFRELALTLDGYLGSQVEGGATSRTAA